MRINVMSVMVDDQAKALRFYTEVLGFVKKREIPIGEHAWLTVVAPEDPEGTELSLEPDERMLTDLDAEASTCPACSATVPRGAERCPSCRLRFA